MNEPPELTPPQSPVPPPPPGPNWFARGALTFLFLFFGVLGALYWSLSEKPSNPQPRSALSPSPDFTVTPDLERALKELEKGLSEIGLSTQKESEQRLKLLGNNQSAQALIRRGLVYASVHDYRRAIADYVAASKLDPTLKEPHWGIAVSIFALSIFDMEARGLARVSKSDAHLVEARMREHSYAQREVALLTSGFLTFTPIANALKAQGWTNQQQMLGASTATLGNAGGLLPEVQRVLSNQRMAFPVGLIPLPSFHPDESVKFILRLAEAEFRKADSAPSQVRLDARTVVFIESEMTSVRGRVNQFLNYDNSSPSLPDHDHVARLKERFKKAMSVNSVSYQAFAFLRRAADNAKTPFQFMVAGSFGLAGGQYTEAEEVFLEALELLPGTDDPQFGLAQAYYGLALFDLLERRKYRVETNELDSGFLKAMTTAPLRLDLAFLSAMIENSTYRLELKKIGLDEGDLMAALSVTIGKGGAFQTNKLCLLRFEPDESAKRVFKEALRWANQAQHASRMPMPENIGSFKAEDMAALTRYLDQQLEIIPELAATSSPTEGKGKDVCEAALDLLLQRRYEQALGKFRLCLERNPQDAMGWYNLAIVYNELRDYDKALECSDKAIALKSDDPHFWNNRGTYLESMFRFRGATTSYQTAQALKPDDPILEKNLTAVQNKYAGLCQSLAKEVKDFEEWPEEQQSYYVRGVMAFRDGEMLRTSEQFLLAIQRFKEAAKFLTGLPGAEAFEIDAAITFATLACSHRAYSPDEILEVLRHAQTSAEKLSSEKKLSKQTELFRALGRVFLLTGRFEDALAEYRNAVALLQGRVTVEEELDCRLQIATVLQSLRAFDLTRAEYDVCEKLVSKGEVSNYSRIRYHLGHAILLLDLHDFEAAYIHCENIKRLVASNPKSIDAGSGFWEITTGNALAGLGRHQEAMTEFNRALDCFRRRNAPRKELGALQHDIGSSLLKLGETQKAIDFCREAVIKNPTWWTHEAFALALESKRDPWSLSEAVSSHFNALASAEAGRDAVLARENRLVWFGDKPALFRNLTSLLLRIEKENLDFTPPKEIRGLGNSIQEIALTIADRAKGRVLADAIVEKYTLSVIALDPKLAAEDRELSLRLSKLSTLREQTSAKDELRRAEYGREIDKVRERRNQIEALTKKTGPGSPSAGSPILLAPWLDLTLTNQNLPAVVRQLPADTGVLEYSIGQRGAWLLLVTQAGITSYRLGVDETAPSVARQPRSLNQLIDAWKDQPSTVGLEGWVRLARARIEDMGKPVGDQRRLVNAPMEQAILEQLTTIILPDSAHFELRRRGIRHLLVVPDGPLHYLPFGILRLKTAKGSQFLIEDYSISSIPSLSLFAVIKSQILERKRHEVLPRKEFLAFANPRLGPPSADDLMTRSGAFYHEYYGSQTASWRPLLEAEVEARTIGSLFGVPTEYPTGLKGESLPPIALLLGQAASEDEVKRLLGNSARGSRWRYILFGTHGIADERNGMFSCLALASPQRGSPEDGFLQAHEVLDLRLDTEIVMLSACQTALGQMHEGEGLVGLSGSFLVAGAESVCATLWAVPSHATTQLSTEFFRQLKESKCGRAEALRRAQLTVLKSGRRVDGTPADYSSPFFWGAFVLSGEFGSGGHAATDQTLGGG